MTDTNPDARPVSDWPVSDWPVSETLHATCIAIGGRTVVIEGPSGSGKSDLALRLVDRGAVLVSDDYTFFRRDGAVLRASPPFAIAGRMEVRGIGIISMPYRTDMPVALAITIDPHPPRMPDGFGTRTIAGIAVPSLRLPALEPSAALKVECALMRVGEMTQ